MKKRDILVAHSPDADDIFMYYAIKLGWVNSDEINFKNIALDIETLNKEALKNIYDISAISFALYPKIREEYALLKTAVSFGDGYGPKLIKKESKKLKRNFKVALSGENTTNALLFRVAYPDAKIVYKNFLDIEKSVMDGEVDAGVLIHESILDFDKSLVVERELWDIWLDLAKEELPLPLGGMAIRRSIPLNLAIESEEILTKAVEIARKNSKTVSKMLMERGVIRVDEKTLKNYLELYANDKSISLDNTQKKAINKLFEIGYNGGFYDEIIECEDFFIPSDYKLLREN